MGRGNYKGLDLVYLLPVMVGEYLPGYLYRCMVAGGHVRMKDLATTLVQRNTIQPPWTLPSNLNRLAEKLWPVFTSGEHLLFGHTCLPAHLPFVAPRNMPRVLAHALDGVAHPGLAAAIGIAGNFVESKPSLRMCPSCVRQDELKRGFAHWHREHALAGVTFCAEHGRPLMKGCGNCRFSQDGSREALLPGRRCWCGSELVPVASNLSHGDGAVLTRVARYARELLDGRLSGRDADAVGAYLQWSACQAGFNAGTRIRSPALVKAIGQRYSTLVQSALNARLVDGGLWAQRIFGLGRTNSVLGRNLLLFDFFGERLPTAEDFAQSQEHQARRAPERRSERPSCADDLTEGVLADRQKIGAFVSERPEASRTDALRALGRVVMRARERDGVWYDSVLPTKPRGGRPDNELKRAQYLVTLDERASAHVYRRRTELLNHPGGHPKAITKTALLKGLPSGNLLNGSVLAQLPKTSAALKSAVETRRQFQRRYALAILGQDGEKSLQQRMWEAYRRTGLSPSELEELNFSLLKEEQWQIPRQGSDC